MGAAIGSLGSGRAMVPFRRRAAEGASPLVWPFAKFSTSWYPMKSLSPCLAKAVSLKCKGASCQIHT